jgi:PAS domain S-box-containing protein
LGYSKEKFIEKAIWEIGFFKDIAANIDKFLELQQDKYVRYEDLPLETSDGRKIHVEFVSNVYLENEKRIIQCNIRDITQRNKAETELKEREMQYRNLADSGIALIWTSGPDKLCNYFNMPWLKFTGHSFEEELGYGWAKGVHPDDLNRCFNTYSNAFDDRRTFEIEYRLKHVSGEYRWIKDLGVPNYDSSGVFVGYIGYCFDITEQKQMENELIKAKERAEESDRLKLAFLANMSHEIRTPMNGILGFAELLKEPNLTGDQQQYYISIIEKSGDRMLNIINDIINISKVESGQMEVLISETDINKQVEYISNFFKHEAEQKGIKILVKNCLLANGAIIKTDREKLYAVLTNLVKNAIKFTKEGSVEIGFEKKDNYLEFFVKDTGIGMNKEQLEIVFERFRQGSELLTRNYEGSGLGLSISKAYIEMLGGKIWIKSKPGKGSTLYFSLPYITEQKVITNIKNVVLDSKEVLNVRTGI